MITAVNGAGLTDEQHMMNALEQVMPGAAVEVTICRGDRMNQITLEGVLITAEHRNAVPQGMAP